MTEKENAGHRQRLRDRFIAAEENSRSEEAMLELLLTYAIPYKDVQPLAKRLLEELGGFLLSCKYQVCVRMLARTEPKRGASKAKK